MNSYRFLGVHPHIFVGVAVAPTTFGWRDGDQIDAPFGSPVELHPGDSLVTWEKLDHPLLELTEDHPFAPRSRAARPVRRTRRSTAAEE